MYSDRDLLEFVVEYSTEDLGVLVVGSRFSGKSRLATALRSAFADASATEVQLLAARRELGARGRGQFNPTVLADEEIRARVEWARAPGLHRVWIVDDADVLVMNASTSMLSMLADVVLERRLFLVLIRNRYVREGAGWFAAREESFAGALGLFRHDIAPLTSDTAALCAASFGVGRSTAYQDQLVEWSGGWVGLMEHLAGFELQVDASGQTPLEQEIARNRDTFRLTRHDLRNATSAALSGYIPPRRALTETGALAVGALACLGVTFDDHSRNGGGVRGRFWREVASSSGARVVAHRDAVVRQTMQRLTRVLASAGHLDELCHEFDLRGRHALEEALVRVEHCSRLFPDMSRSVAILLAEFLGVLGLRRILRQQNIDSGQMSSPRDLARHLIDALPRH